MASDWFKDKLHNSIVKPDTIEVTLDELLLFGFDDIMEIVKAHKISKVKIYGYEFFCSEKEAKALLKLHSEVQKLAEQDGKEAKESGVFFCLEMDSSVSWNDKYIIKRNR